MTFEDYYKRTFADDLSRVIAALPPETPHPDWEAEVTTQPRTISNANPVIHAWDEDHVRKFASALFLTVLVDEVCYTHFREQYPKFRLLTNYPKFRGDCPSACTHHLHPADIFLAINSEPDNWSGQGSLCVGSLKMMHTEVARVFGSGTIPVHVDNFWEKCLREVPVRWR
jgi:hypothetical protein